MKILIVVTVSFLLVILGSFHAISISNRSAYEKIGIFEIIVFVTTYFTGLYLIVDLSFDACGHMFC